MAQDFLRTDFGVLRRLYATSFTILSSYSFIGHYVFRTRSRDSAVGIAGWPRGGGSSVCGIKNFLFSTSSRQALRDHPTSYPKGSGGSFPGGIAAGEWSSPLTSGQCRGQENVDLYIHSPICLHGVVLNQLSTGTTLPFTYFGLTGHLQVYGLLMVKGSAAKLVKKCQASMEPEGS
jgi:hypothetical protein